MRCEICKKSIVNETKYQDWLSLMNFLEFLFHEGYIEEGTYEIMVDRLMTLKVFAFENEEEIKKKGSD
jgi:hypothetical protein